MRADGLTSANPDAPPELEGDAWTWAREGTLFKNLGRVYRRNVYGDERTWKQLNEFPDLFRQWDKPGASGSW
jgi:hypothetical protein